MAQYFPNFAPLAERYDAFILDLWGVIHDGQNLYSGAKDCLERLRRDGKKIVLLSNAPRRASSAAETLERMGITAANYDALVTSGEVAYETLADKNSSVFRPSGKKYIYIGLERDRRTLAGLDFEETDDPSQASFLLLAHSFHDHQPISELAPLLARCIATGLPALCINPDAEVVRLTGERVACAGVIAAYYAQQGGKVIYFGKPHNIVYEHTFAVLKGVSKDRILAVGDTIATDIKGAVQAGVSSALVTGGVLKATVGEPGTPEYHERCDVLFAEFGAAADYVLPAFNY